MPHPYLDIDAVRRSAAGRWDAILTDLAPSLAPALARPGRHVTCPVHGGQGDFRVFRNVAATGGGICSCGAFPDGFALLIWANQWRFPDALAAVARWLGMDPGASTRPPPVRTVPVSDTRQTVADPAADARRRERLQQTWDTALPLWDPQALPARRYLARRGLTLATYPEFLRLHTALSYFNEDGVETGHWPTLLAVVSDPDGQPVTLHRTYLTAEGTKAPVEPVRKLMTYPNERMLTGGAIRLFPAGAALGVAEGTETALAVRQATGLPIWSAISAGLLAQFRPPAGVREVLIWADLDRSGAGQGAAAALARLSEEVSLPPPKLLI